MKVVASDEISWLFFFLQYYTGSVVHLSLMQPILDDKAQPDGFVVGSDDKEEDKKEAVIELLKVELVLNVPPVEDGGKM